MIKLMKSLMMLSVGLLLMLNHAHAQVTDAQDKKVQWLFLVHGDNAKIQKVDGKLQLVVSKTDMVTAFGDRPVRQVHKMTMTDLNKLWSEGADSFKKDPPNTGITFNDESGVIVLTDMTIDGDQAIFTFTMDDNTKDPFTVGIKGRYSMVIDNQHVLKDEAKFEQDKRKRYWGRD